MNFFLGCHQPDWLGKLKVPMFVSHHRLRKVRPCPMRPVASCANCVHHALVWRQKILTPTEPRPIQTVLF